MCEIGMLRDGFTYQVSNWICWGMCRESGEEPIRVPLSNGTVRQYKRVCSPISREAGQFGYVLL